MKRFISSLISISLILSGFTAFADETTSADMERVLRIVKQKIEVSQNLTEFSGGADTNGEEQFYSFYWSDPNGGSLSIYSDSEGRIISYGSYMPSRSEAKISPFSKAEVISECEAFLKRTLPEAYRDDTDMLVYDETSYNIGSSLRFSLTFVREKNGVKVKNNDVRVSGYIFEDKISIYDMSANINYDTEFSDNTDTISDYEAKYREAFPVEVVYYDEYANSSKIREDKTVDPTLMYRIKDFNAGYISAADGAVVTEDSESNGIFREESSADKSEMNSSVSMGGGLSEVEIKELGKIEGLISQEDAKKAVLSLPYVETDNMPELSSISFSILGNDEYAYRFYGYTDNSNFSATVNAHNKKVLNLSNNSYAKRDIAELSESEKQKADKKILEFLEAAAKEELKSVEEENSSYSNGYASKSYIRLVNGIKYVGDGIYVSFDCANNTIRSYNLDFSDKQFDDPTGIITPDVAYDAILSYSPIEKLYVKSGGKYILCFAQPKNTIRIDAFTEDVLGDGIQNTDFTYSDISSHWAEEAITKLGEVQIGFAGNTFEPDKAITQSDLLRFFAAGIKYKYYLDADEEELYRMLIDEGIVLEEEKAPDAEVTRSRAFVYMIRLAGVEKVAQLSDIYKIEYADGNLMDSSLIGYSAILSGLGVICGDGGYLRPLDSITRAEAAIMLYRYMLTF